MRRLILTLLAGVITFAISGLAQAGLLSLIGASNNTNDFLQDRSWGNAFIYDEGGKSATEVFGLARIDKVNNSEYDPDNSVWMVYSFKQMGKFEDIAGGNVPEDLAPYKNWMAHGTPEKKTIDSLLGVTGTGNAMVALVELNSKPTGVLASLLDDQPADLTSAFEELQTLIGQGQAKWIASFGIVDHYRDVVLISEFDRTTDKASELLALSLVETNGVNESDFKPLFTVAANDPVYYPNYEFASFRFLTVTDQGDLQYTDQGTVIVNYVPEPSSLLGLIGVAISGLGVHFTRRRRK